MPAEKVSVWRTCLPAFVFVVLLLLCCRLYDWYVPVGPDLLQENEWRTYKTSPWSVSQNLAEIREGSMISDVRENNRGRVSLRLDGVQPDDLLRLRGEARADQIVCGKAGWQLGRVTLIYDKTSKTPRKSYPHYTGALTGSCDWVSFDLLSPVQEDATYARLDIINQGRSGRYEVRNLSLVPVGVKRSAPYVFWGGIGGLAVLWGWYLRRFNLAKRPWGRWLLLVSIAIFTGVLLPGQVVDDTPMVTAMVMDKGVQKMARSESVQKVAPILAPESPQYSEWIKRKNRAIVWIKELDIHRVGHFGLFFLFGIACGLCFLSGETPARVYAVHREDGKKFLYLLAGMLIFSSVAELIQAVSISRTMGWFDWSLNIHGATSGLLLFVVCHLGWHPIRRLMQGVQKKAFR